MLLEIELDVWSGVSRPLHAAHSTRSGGAIEESDHNHRCGLSKERARHVVADAVTESADALSAKETTYYLKFLHDRGELYYVGDFVRITQPDELGPDSEDTNESE